MDRKIIILDTTPRGHHSPVFAVDVPSSYDGWRITGEDIEYDPDIVVLDAPDLGDLRDLGIRKWIDEREQCALGAEEMGADEWTVTDRAGGRWWPDDEAGKEIATSNNPEGTALRICIEQPMRGEWCN